MGGHGDELPTVAAEMSSRADEHIKKIPKSKMVSS